MQQFFEKYKKHTDELLQFLVDNDIKTILGGGDIVAAAAAANLNNVVFCLLFEKTEKIFPKKQKNSSVIGADFC